jgi:DNA replication and repair protein RecF
MHLTHLSLTNYRNFARLDIDVPGGPLLLVGNNAQGKTSLLEAVYYLATFTSFHASSDRQLINFAVEGEPLAVARIVAEFRYAPGEGHPAHAPRRLEVRIIRDASNGSPRMRKEILLDGVNRRAADAIGAFNAVLFLPQMLVMVEGGPEERRRYLNLALSQALPHYAASLTDYQRALTQRNALLKLIGERGGDPGQLEYWDEQVARIGARIIEARIHAVLELERLARRFHHELTRGQEMLRLDYQPAYDPLPAPPQQLALGVDVPADRSKLSVEQICLGFIEQLKKLRAEEIARGVTTIGPHRDELRFFANGIDLGIYGSRGQGRTAVLSMKLAEVAWMKSKTGQWPVLLLDEVMAELDPARRMDLLDRLAGAEQSMLTTTDLDLFSPEFTQTAQTWRITAGRVT